MGAMSDRFETDSTHPGRATPSGRAALPSDALSAYMPQDRRIAAQRGVELPGHVEGVILFADITGFTPLTEELAHRLGRRRGAESLIQILNQLYPPLIEAVEHHQGSVIGFSGDAMTCLFGGESVSISRDESGRESVEAGLAAAIEMQRVLSRFTLPQESGVEERQANAIAIRITITSGALSRIVVGDPALYVMDAVAGTPLERVAVGDHLAQTGEILLDEACWRALGKAPVDGWRVDEGMRFGVWNDSATSRSASHGSVPQVVRKNLSLPHLPAEIAARWVLPPLRAALAEGQEQFVSELRPAVALFVRFSGIDFRDAEQAAGQLDTYVRWAQGVIDHYDGSMIQVTTGDKGAYLYAVFGAPVAHDDDIQRALLAATALSAPPASCDFIEQTQVGASYGLMRVGAYGGPTRRTYGVQGEAVNTAARLMAAAADRQVLATQSIADEVRSLARSGAIRISVEEFGTLALKGKSAPATVFTVFRNEEAAPIAPAHRFDAPLVGREPELRLIASALAEIGMRDPGIPRGGRLVVLEGAAGIGKSHLLNVAVENATRVGWEALAAASHSTTQQTPFAAAHQFVGALLQLDLAGEQRKATASEMNTWNAQVRGALLAIVPDAAERAPLLNEVMGTVLEESGFTRALDARQRQEALIALLLAVVQARAATSRLLFVLEDAHWLDEPSIGILGALLAMLEYAPVAAVTTVRTGGLPSAIIAGEAQTRHLVVGDLANDAVGALVEQRLGSPLSVLARALIQLQSQGNPFFAEELSDALVEAGSLTLVKEGSTGFAWHLSSETIHALRVAHCLVGEEGEATLRTDAPLADANLGVPNSIHGIILARLDRLPDAARLTLKVASVVGRSFSARLLRQVRSLENLREGLDANIAHALARDFVRVDSGRGSEGSAPDFYFFKHNIIRDVAYNTLLDAQQRGLHEEVGAALEVTQPDATEELALHFYRSDTSQPRLRERALLYLTAAARRSQHDYANETALSFYSRALELEDSPSLRMGAIEVLHILGRREEEAALLARISNDALAPSGQFAADEARLWGDYYESIGNYPEALAWVGKALDLAATSEDRTGEARAWVRRGTIQWRQGEFDEAESAFQSALALLNQEEHGSADTGASELADAYYGLGLIRRQQGQIGEAQSFLEENLRLRRIAPNPEREARTLNALGHLRSKQHDHPGAHVYYEQSLELRRAIGDRVGVGSSLLSVAQALCAMGRLSQAEPVLQEALRIQRSTRDRFLEGTTWNELGILQWIIGDYAQAIVSLEAALAISREIDSESLMAYVLCNLGQAQRDSGLLAEADGTLQQGLALAQAQQDANLEAIYYTDFGLALHYAGKDALALEQLHLAQEAYTQLELASDRATVLAIRALVYLALGDGECALLDAETSLRLLNGASPESLEFAHRDYHFCAQTLRALGRDAEALHYVQRARDLLQTRAARIEDPVMRASYLERVATNRAILS